MNRFNVRKPLLSVVMLCAMGIVGCKDDSTAGGGQPYDPSKPIELTDFYPKEGKYQEKVILQGSNFGTDPSAIRVYFNQRPAAVIGTTGSEVYVQAPRLPGDECKLSVVIGEDSVVYNDIFLYESSMTVATVVGNGTKIYKAGTLAEAQVSPYYCCVDESGNVFVISRNGDEGDVSTIARIDEVNSELVTLASNTIGNVPCVDPETQVVSFATETTIGSFMTLDPKEMWAPRYREMKWPAGIPAQITNGYKHCMVVNPDDGYIYCRFYFGQVVRIDPKSYETTVIAVTPQGDSYGLSFNPQHPNILYITMDSNGLAYETPQERSVRPTVYAASTCRPTTDMTIRQRHRPHVSRPSSVCRRPRRRAATATASWRMRSSVARSRCSATTMATCILPTAITSAFAAW